jgi:hypothetical protein
MFVSPVETVSDILDLANRGLTDEEIEVSMQADPGSLKDDLISIRWALARNPRKLLDFDN